MSEKYPAPARPRPVLREATVDDAIDRAVRQIAQVDPRPGLSRRVHSRIAVPARRRSVYSARFIAVAGALAVLVLAVGLLRPDSTRDVAPPGTSTSQAPAPRAHLSEPLTPQPDGSSPEQVSERLDSAPPAVLGPDGQAKPAASTADSPAARKTVTGGQLPNEPAAMESRRRLVAPTEPGTHAEAIQMPEIGNVFGATRNLVTGANVAEATAAPSVNTQASPLEVVELSMPPLTIEPLTITPLRAPANER